MKPISAYLFTFLRFLNRFAVSRSKTAIIVYSIIITCILGIIDYYTTPDFSFAIFYMIPVSIAAWYAGRKTGFFISIFCSFTVYFVHLLWPRFGISYLVPYWDALTQFLFFYITAIILAKLRATLDRESNIARTDYLTGISNSRYFYEVARLEMKRANRKSSCTSIMYLDLDDFKKVNDTLGHFEGNTVLKLAALTLKNTVREIDLVARFGGDEFVVLMPDTDFDETETTVQRVKTALDETLVSGNWKVTTSIGAITCRGIDCSLDQLITTADQLMYDAKMSGKNKVIHKNFDETTCRSTIPDPLIK